MPSYYRSRVVNEPYHFYSRKSGYVQKLPYDHPLPYDAVIILHHDFKKLWYDTPKPINDASIGFFAASGSAYNKAYERFIACTKDSANLSEDLAERRQSINMIAKRLSSLVRAVNSLKKFNFTQAARDLGLRVTQVRGSRRRTYVTVIRDKNTAKFSSSKTLGNKTSNVDSASLSLKKGMAYLGSNFLEYHFGWEPIIKDIEFLLQIAMHKVDLGAKYKCIGTASEKVKPVTPTYPNVAGIHTQDVYTRISALVSATVTVTDENSLLLNQLGLINPAVTAWNAMPLSFLLDWVTNVQTLLSGYTDLVGMSLTDAFTTISGTWERRTFRTTNELPGGWQTYVKSEDLGVSVKRVLGVNPPQLPILRPLKLPSVTRALTAASLLSQALGTKV